MGQNSSQSNRSIISNWQQHPYEQQIVLNVKTNEQLHRHYVMVMDPEELAIYNKRMRQHYSYISRVVYYHPEHSQENTHQTNSFPKSFFVYTDRMISIKKWSIEILQIVIKSLRKLYGDYGAFRVQNGMIGQN